MYEFVKGKAQAIFFKGKKLISKQKQMGKSMSQRNSW